MNELRVPVAERISALSDGRLTGDEFVQAMNDMHDDPLAVSTWQAYHLVGDVMRQRELLPAASDFAFWEKLELRLAAEPCWPLSGNEEDGAALVEPLPVVAMRQRVGVPEANAPVFGWKVLACGLSTVLFGVVGVALWIQPDVQMSVQVLAPSVGRAVAPQFVAKDVEAGIMVRDPQLDELMAAHRQLGGHSILQVPTVFLRNATFEESAR
jgi:sigma-E factor negative regulatory protein RseA